MIPTFTDYPPTRPFSLMAEVVDVTMLIARSTADLCRHKFRRGDLVNELVSLGKTVGEIAERLAPEDVDGADVVNVLHLERRCSAHLPEFLREPDELSWSAHYELCPLKTLSQVMDVMRQAIESGQTSKVAVRALVAEKLGKAVVIADPSQPWHLFYRDALRQHFGGRLGDDLIDEIVTQQTRFRREWERAQMGEVA